MHQDRQYCTYPTAAEQRDTEWIHPTVMQSTPSGISQPYPHKISSHPRYNPANLSAPHSSPTAHPELSRFYPGLRSAEQGPTSYPEASQRTPLEVEYRQSYLARNVATQLFTPNAIPASTARGGANDHPSLTFRHQNTAPEEIKGPPGPEYADDMVYDLRNTFQAMRPLDVPYPTQGSTSPSLHYPNHNNFQTRNSQTREISLVPHPSYPFQPSQSAWYNANSGPGGDCKIEDAGEVNYGPTHFAHPQPALHIHDSQSFVSDIQSPHNSLLASTPYSDASSPPASESEASPYPLDDTDRRSVSTTPPSSADTGPTTQPAKKKSKMHVCLLCDRPFSRPSGLKTHMNVHSGEKPFKCEVETCHRMFAVRSNAKRHLRVHGVTPSPHTRGHSRAKYSVDFDTPKMAPYPERLSNKGPVRLKWVDQDPLPKKNVKFLSPLSDSGSEEGYLGCEDGDMFPEPPAPVSPPPPLGPNQHEDDLIAG